MPFPNFLRSTTKVQVATSAAAGGGAGGGGAGGGGAGGGGAGGTSKKLNFPIQTQTQSNWCWSAVGTSVSHFYTAASPWTQCTLATSTLPAHNPPQNCCSNPSVCNVPYYLDRTLRVTENLNSMIGSDLSFADVQTQINSDAPIGCRVGWYNGAGQLDGSGHFMVIAGWRIGETGTRYMNIEDPIFLGSEVVYDNFASMYQSGGEWTHSYLTERPPAGGGAVALALPELPVADPSAIGA